MGSPQVKINSNPKTQISPFYKEDVCASVKTITIFAEIFSYWTKMSRMDKPDKYSCAEHGIGGACPKVGSRFHESCCWKTPD